MKYKKLLKHLSTVVLKRAQSLTRSHRRHARKRKKSQLFSRLIRPVFENHRRIRLVVGAQLAASIIFVSSLGPIGGEANLDQPEIAVLNEQTVQVLTETTFRFPLETNAGISQGFHRFHPGIDIQSPRGSSIYPIANGKVVEVEIGRFGFGHKVVVEHQNGLTSLYAHMDEVNVREGDEVTKETVLGKVGLTGWTTGPHLHLEIHTQNGALNPKQALPET